MKYLYCLLESKKCGGEEGFRQTDHDLPPLIIQTYLYFKIVIL